MNAILLVGGLGTRLRPLTLDRPKALLPVLNKPFLRYQLDLLEAAGVQHAMLAAGPEARHWQNALEQLKPKRLKLHFCYEKKRLGTGGAIRFAYDELVKRRLSSLDPVLVFNGDVLIELDVKRFVNFHRRKESLCTVALHRVKEASRYGVVKIRPNGRIYRFLEKPKNYRGPALINAGAYLLDPSLIHKIFPGRVVSIERQGFPRFLSGGDPMFGFSMGGYWNDIGTHATYLQAHRDLLTRKNRWTPNTFLRKSVLVDPSASVSPKVAMNGMVCVGKRARVEKNCVVRDSVILEEAHIGAGTIVAGSIIGPGCRIGENCELKSGTVLGPKTLLPNFTRC